ncbi:MAG TPA: MFS transporter [Solirubrobacterales bacterium]|jgi:MFS family permease
MRRLLILAAAIVFVDTMFYAAIAPILPALSDEFGLSKSAAGVLAGSYAAGTLVAALPAGLVAARIGTRPTVLGGLTLMSIAGLGFAFGESELVLDASRFVQGVGGAASWAGVLGWLIGIAPSERRGELIGATMAFAIGGVLFGPVVGGAAEELGRGPVFAAAAVFGVVLIVLTLRLDVATPPALRQPGMVRTAFAAPGTLVAMWLVLMPGVLFGTLEVLVPLRMDELGAGAAAIAVTFIVAGIAEAITTPVTGRMADRRGRIFPTLLGLLSSAGFMVVLGLPEAAWLVAVLVVAATPAIATLWSPSMAMLADAGERAGVPQGLAMGISNLGWAVGNTVGATGGAGLGELAGDVVAYLVLAAICLATAAFLVSSRGRRSLPVEKPAEEREPLRESEPVA